MWDSHTLDGVMLMLIHVLNLLHSQCWTGAWFKAITSQIWQHQSWRHYRQIDQNPLQYTVCSKVESRRGHFKKVSSGTILNEILQQLSQGVLFHVTTNKTPSYFKPPATLNQNFGHHRKEISFQTDVIFFTLNTDESLLVCIKLQTLKNLLLTG